MNNFNDVMKLYFDQLEIDPIEFIYNEKTNKYITSKSFQNNEDDPEAYYLVVRMINNVGNVLIGTSDGINFTEIEMLGQIMIQDDRWINL